MSEVGDLRLEVGDLKSEVGAEILRDPLNLTHGSLSALLI